MHVPSTIGFASPKLPAVTDFVSRLAARLMPEAPTQSPRAAVAAPPTTLTPAMLRATLLGMGVATDAQNLALAEAFAHLGLPLTREMLSEANGALARAPGASPLAYALARAWSLPTTPAALNALTAVTTGNRSAPPTAALPPELLSWLGLAAEAGMEPEMLAGHLFVTAHGMGRSTESRLAGQLADGKNALGTVQDTRTTLRRLAEGSADPAIRRGAEALATHIEGQQLVNQAARRDAGAEILPFYCAVPLCFGEETTLAEMQLWSWDAEAGQDDRPADTPWLRATVRLVTARLGRVQAELSGTLAGTLTCRLGAEKPATARLLHRNTGTLTAALGTLGGWRTSEVHCRVQSEWPPLWHGGDTLMGPRPCVDWRA